MQFLRITCHTGPLGLVTCGRVGLPPICAATGAASAATMTARTDQIAAFPNLHFIGSSFSFVCLINFLELIRERPNEPLRLSGEVRCSYRYCPAQCRTDGGCSIAYWTSSACCPGTQCDDSP